MTPLQPTYGVTGRARRIVGLRTATAGLLALILVLCWSYASGAASPSAPTPQHLIVGSRITLPHALFEANQRGQSVLVTTNQARQIEEAMWQAWERAMIDNDTRALKQLIAPGPVLEGIIDNCAFPVGQCANERHVRPIRSLTTIVPAQHAYPIYFLSEIQTTALVQDSQNVDTWQPWLELQILTKATPSSSWMLSFDSGYNATNGGTPPLLPFDPGMVQPYPHGGSGHLQPQQKRGGRPIPGYPAAQYLQDLAEYWQSYVTTGHAPDPTVFVTDGTTSGVGEQLAQSPQGSEYAGHTEYKSFGADPSTPSWSFIAKGGYPMVCGSVVDTATDVPPASGSLYQNADETNYGIPLAAGQYGQIVSKTAHETCVYPVVGGFDASGNDTYAYAVSGTLIQPAPPQAASSTPSDLETDYAVLAHELAEYQTKLKTCQQDGGNSCLNVVNNDISGEFGLFADRLMSDKFSSSERPTVSSLYATSVKLSRLFQNAQTNPGNLGKDSSEINAEAARFLRESLTLLQQLTGVSGKNA